LFILRKSTKNSKKEFFGQVTFWGKVMFFGVKHYIYKGPKFYFHDMGLKGTSKDAEFNADFKNIILSYCSDKMLLKKVIPS
jgi:hypothetical protein